MLSFISIAQKDTATFSVYLEFIYSHCWTGFLYVIVVQFIYSFYLWGNLRTWSYSEWGG